MPLRYLNILIPVNVERIITLLERLKDSSCERMESCAEKQVGIIKYSLFYWNSDGISDSGW